MCHVSRVTCHVSQKKRVKKIKNKKYNYGKSGGASRSRVCYQRGLPRLVLGSKRVLSKTLHIKLCTHIRGKRLTRLAIRDYIVYFQFCNTMVNAYIDSFVWSGLPIFKLSGEESRFKEFSEVATGFSRSPTLASFCLL